MFKQISAIAAFLLSISYISGQSIEPAAGQWNKATVIAYALKGNADLRVAKLSIDIAEAQLEQTGLLPNPELEVEYANDFAFNNEGEYDVRIGFSQRFPLANRLKKAKAISRVDIAKAKMEVRIQERAIANTISEIALEIQIVDARVELLGRLFKNAEEISAFIHSRVEKGEYSSLEANQATLEAHSLKQEIRQLRDQRNHLSHSLVPYLGLPPEIDIDFEASDPIDLTGPLPDFDISILERHPEFQLATLEAHAAEAEIALAEAENWETVTARLFWKNERGIDQPGGLETDRFLGIGMTIPIPLRRSGDLRAKEYRIARDQSHMKAAAIKLGIQHDVEHARHEARDLQQSVAAFRENVIKLAKEQLDETRIAHQKGQISLVSLLRSQNQLLALEHNYLDSLESFARARLKLEIARVDTPELQNQSF